MRTRAISAALLVPVVAIPFLLGNPWLTLGVAVLAALAGREAANLVRRAGLPADPGITILLPPLAVLATLAERTLAASMGFAALVVGIAAVVSFRKPDLPRRVLLLGRRRVRRAVGRPARLRADADVDRTAAARRRRRPTASSMPAGRGCSAWC